MDNKLIDSLLTSLLNIPHTDRTTADVQATLLFAAEAANIPRNGANSIQLEQLKLIAATRHLAEEVGATSWRVTLAKANNTTLDLFCRITFEEWSEDKPEQSAIGIGTTAEEALAYLHRQIKRATAETKAAA